MADRAGYNNTCIVYTENLYKAVASAVVGVGIGSSIWSLALLQPNPGAPQNGGWALNALAACGFAAAVVAVMGISAAAWRSTKLLSAHVALLALLFSAQICMSVAVAIQQQAEHQHPPPLGNGWPSAAPIVHLADPAHPTSFAVARLANGTSPIILPPTELLATEIMAGVLMGLELMALGLGCLLQTGYSQVEEALEDALDEESARQPLMRRSLQPQMQPPTPEIPGDEASEWRARMQARYGLDTRMFTYDPHTAQRTAAEAPQLVPSIAPRQRQASSRCTIM
uniref:Uncharacterized protein n=1 Tax=Dunaliella tertiolecta TaxID=3047 RepID=A0A7S3QUW6_DUNTE|mmetsp:Transcript_12667/g.34581  ORF Transcript_12667/g.34581 Transcript_12667/m.34581 type:complete len:283 (+) Transcript_12667:148-996(+)|eukprot:CAMPEP_0202338776 /NCGR_PEP_ID=MMETSP1126-20121109/915_1 /ASSEMBLY_ACC=CAM_ASM_000457 /TAXON_ID=3047 /ORGANISM="Dunaliella tertiolecta, Strain CCMP1320" /LENGTH=282 /DNA_ID=CAMNT_0048929219 /DNA_START=80 /DNA_END=928 /DNA_ORIENTATION=+